MIRRVTVHLPGTAGEVLVELDGERAAVAIRENERDLWVPIELAGGRYTDNLAPAGVFDNWTLLSWFFAATIASAFGYLMVRAAT